MSALQLSDWHPIKRKISGYVLFSAGKIDSDISSMPEFLGGDKKFRLLTQFLGSIECMRCRLLLPMCAVSVRLSVT